MDYTHTHTHTETWSILLNTHDTFFKASSLIPNQRTNLIENDLTRSSLYNILLGLSALFTTHRVPVVKPSSPATYLEVHTRSPSRLSKNGDVVRVSTKAADVPVYPGDGSLLVPQTIVSC